MAYDREFLRVTWGFSIINSDEIAVTGLNFSDPAAVGWDALDALDEITMAVTGPLLLARMNELLAGSVVRWADYSRLNWVRIAAVLTTGLEVDPAKRFDDPTPFEGIAADVLPQASVVLSTRSGLSSGSANFGRMFLPHTRWVLETGTPSASAADTVTFANASQIFINGVQDDLDAVITQSVQPTIMTQVVGGASKRINQIALGDVTDTQRRRRNQLPEIYVFRPIP